MAIVTGTNAGFVTVAPSVDPGGAVADIERRANGIKVTSPAGSNKVVELGWWQDYTSNPVEDYEIAIYDHDAGNDRPGNIVGSKVTGALTANTAGWYSLAADISLTASTTYWIVVQTDGVFADNTVRYDSASSGGQRLIIKTNQDTLPDPYGVEAAALADYNAAMYAKYEAVGGLSIPVAMHHYRQLRN